LLIELSVQLRLDNILLGLEEVVGDPHEYCKLTGKPDIEYLGKSFH
jgi:hypothetical protein